MPKRLLIVDDEPHLLRALEALLGAEGFEEGVDVLREGEGGGVEFGARGGGAEGEKEGDGGNSGHVGSSIFGTGWG